MARNIMRTWAVLFFVWIAAGVPTARAEAWHDFSADMVTTAGGQSVHGRIFVSREKTRMEMPQSIMITRFDKKVAWVIMPTQNMYMEHPLDPNILARVSKEVPGEIERVSLGPEPADGRPAQKYKVTYSESGRQNAVYQWIGESEIPLKIEAVDGSWAVEYKNMQTGPQPDSLFELPEGYQKLEMPTSSTS